MPDKLKKILTKKINGVTAKQRGNVLLLALLLLASGIVGGLTVAVLVISELRQASSIDNALVAYSDAESGLEQTLYDVRQEEICLNGDCDDGQNYNNCKNVANCEVNINSSSQVVIPLLKKDETFQLDLEPGVNNDNIEYFEVYWTEASADHSYLEITFINKTVDGFEVLKPNSGSPYVCDFTSTAGECLETENDPISFSTGGVLLNSDNTNQVRFKALYNNIINLRIEPGDNKKFSHYLDVKSRSQKKNVQQVLQTNIPSQLPAYGFVDYVLFTEQAIVK
ncbi:MAG: hypothetical protein WC575_00600 [Patescibacteria group bacterium]